MFVASYQFIAISTFQIYPKKKKKTAPLQFNSNSSIYFNSLGCGLFVTFDNNTSPTLNFESFTSVSPF